LSTVVCISVGVDDVELVDEVDEDVPAADCRSAFSEASMLVSAVESALSSDELIVPDATSDWSSACNLCKGEL
jgi:hypothetical protein